MSRPFRCLVGILMLFSLATAANADLRTVYLAGPIMYPGADPDYPQQSAVNKNIGSPYYGYLYIADYRGVTGVPKIIHIWKPVNTAEGTGAAQYEDTGLQILTEHTSLYDPFAVAVGPDDTVWIGEFDSGVILSAPPVPPFGTSVTATSQITGVGNVRGLTVVGPITDVQLYLTGSSTFVKKYTGSAPDPEIQGTFDLVYNTSVATLVGYGPYGSAVDLDGNLYIVTKSSAAGANAFNKIDPLGNIVPFPSPIPPNFISTSDLSSASFVPDKTYPGGGYLYSINRTATTTNGGDMGMRFDLNGNYLDGYGPAKDPAPANYTPLAILRNNTYGTTDDLGNVIQKTSFGGNGAYIKVIKRAPFLVASAEATTASAPVKSSPTAVDGVVYFGATDGFLYAYTTADGNPVPGFPVDISAAVGETVQLLGRPSVYYGKFGKAIYVTTNRGDVVKVKPDGSIGWANGNRAGTSTNTATAPAVTSDGWVYATINGKNGVQLLRIDELTGESVLESAVLAPASGSVSNPAVQGSKVYLGVQEGTTGDLLVMNSADLSPLATFAGDEGVIAPPHVNGPDAYVGTLAGNLYKINSANATLDQSFGTDGAAVIGEPLVTDAFVKPAFPMTFKAGTPNSTSGTASVPNDTTDGAGVVSDLVVNSSSSNAAVIVPLYIGTAKGKVFEVDCMSGIASVLYDTTDEAGVVGGLVVNPSSGTIAFGTSSGLFYQVPEGVHAAQVFRGYGAFNGAPTYDLTTGRFLIGSDDKNVYAFSCR